MEPLRTPDYASEAMRAARGISALHVEELRARDRDDSRAVSAWNFRRAAWDPCFDVSVGSAIRTADYALVGRTDALCVDKFGSAGMDYSAYEANNTRSPTMNIHTSPKISAPPTRKS